MSDRSSPATSVDEILDLYRRFGAETYDEVVSQIDHARQTAALAQAAGAADALVAAALLHDVGHLLDLEAGAAPPGPDTLDRHHEAAGARYLAGVFPPEVVGPVALHVAAKRYRCAVDPGHLVGLSDGSRRSLVVQGGPMTPAEAAAFEASPGHDEAVLLRGWDDAGKVEGLDVPSFASYGPLLERLVT
ncbi:MAG: hypothetical protein R2726_10845 [Acidimicrobiales bacterium]